MAMAIVVSNKTQDFNYHVQCIQSFLMECGRVQAVLSNTVVQSDQEDHLIALLNATAAKLGNNITVRQSPAYSSQSQGSVERFHRTLMGTSQNIESTTRNQLRRQHYKSTSNYTMACTTRSLPAQQIRNTCRWQHKLLQKMEQGTSNTTM